MNQTYEIFDCDETLRDMTEGDNYFVLYAEETKMQTFATRKEAKAFINSITK